MKTIAFFCCLLAFPSVFWAQNASQPDSGDLRIVIAAGLTPVVPHHQHEVIFFNTLSTYQFDAVLANGTSDTYRSSRLNHLLQWMYGFSQSNRICAGLEAQFAHLRVDSDEEASPWKVLSGSTPALGASVHTLTAVGPKVRYTPFARHYEFTLQGSLLFPTGKRDYRTALDEDRLRINLQGSYLTPLPARFYLYAGADIQCKPANNTRKQTTWLTPLNLYVFNKIVEGRIQNLYVFVNLGYVSSFEKEYKGGLRQVNSATYWGIGAQWAITRSWSLSANWQGLLGVDDFTDLDKSTYTSFGLGGRYMGALWE